MNKKLIGKFIGESFEDHESGLVMFNREKFAELIVRECANLFEDDGSASSLNEWVGNNRAKDTILKHFGIEG